MNAEQLRNAIWKIDDKFIAEAETYEPETRSIKPVYIIAPASAAVIALCTCLHFHNSVNQMLDPEIDNGVVVTDTVTETESCETDAAITEIKTEVSYSPETGSAVMDTETSYTESGYESSTPYAVTVPAKTETPSGGSSSGEKTVITQGRSEITLQPVTEETDVQTIVPVTEPVVTVPADTEKVTTENAGEFPTPTLWPTVEPTRPPTVKPTIAPTRLPTVNPTQILDPTTDPTRLPTVEPTMVRPTTEPTLPPTVSPTDSTVTMEVTVSDFPSPTDDPYKYSIEDFPYFLRNEYGKVYIRNQIVEKDQVGKFILNETMKDDDGITYDVSEYLRKAHFDKRLIVIYFKEKDCYVFYDESWF